MEVEVEWCSLRLKGVQFEVKGVYFEVKGWR